MENDVKELERMTIGEILLGLIYLNPHPRKMFSEEKLCGGLYEAIKHYPRLEQFFRLSGDGTIPESSSSLEKGLGFMLTGRIIQMCGKDIFSKLEPLAKLVWDSANSAR
ncbi:MAG: hypothetical protein WC584_03210 [Candidatus Pacearchaeota archaeon]